MYEFLDSNVLVDFSNILCVSFCNSCILDCAFAVIGLQLLFFFVLLTNCLNYDVVNLPYISKILLRVVRTSNS